MKEYVYYTDGACTLNQTNGEYEKGPGGWGWVEVENDTIVKQRGWGSPNTTNNEMELSAIHNALCRYSEDHFKKDETSMVIYSDSAYCINIFTQWVKGWEANGWTRGRKHEPIKNLELIQNIWAMIQLLSTGFSDVKFVKVKGHSGDGWNEYADKIAVENKLKFS